MLVLDCFAVIFCDSDFQAQSELQAQALFVQLHTLLYSQAHELPSDDYQWYII